MRTKTNRFSKKAVYSDVDISRKDVTIFKYLGGKTGSVYFKIIGGQRGYYTKSTHDTYGISYLFSHPIMNELSSIEIRDLIARGIIKERDL